MRRRARAVAQCALFELPVVVIAHQRSLPPIRSTARCPIMRSSCRRCSRTASTSCTSTPRSPLASRSSLCSPSPPKASLRYAPHVRGTCPRYALPTQLARNSRTLHARRTSQFRVAANARRCSRSRALDRFSPLRAAVTRAGARPFLAVTRSRYPCRCSTVSRRYAQPLPVQLLDRFSSGRFTCEYKYDG